MPFLPLKTWMLLIRALLQPGPLYFHKPTHRTKLYDFYHWLNPRFMRFRYKLGALHFVVRGQACSAPQLKTLFAQWFRPDCPTLVVANHVSYIDPHVLFQTVLEAEGPEMSWMTGVEALEKSVGPDAWVLRSCGAFSIDRGALDKRSLAFAQDTLARAVHPLMIFPEGEAGYRSGTVRAFSEGAFRFAVNVAEKNGKRDVRIVPIGLRYRFADEASVVEKHLQQAMHRLVDDLSKDTTLAVEPLPTDLSTEAMLRQLLRRCGDALHREYFGNTPRIDEETPDILQRVMRRILEMLAIEHGLELSALGEEVFGDYAALMQLKNRLRSLINRKVRALPLADLEHLDKVLAAMEPAEPQALPALSWMEDVLTGEKNASLPPEKRIAGLRSFLDFQRADATLKAEASPETLAHWRKQLTDCRRVKLLWLLLDDLARWEPSPEHLDETLMKLEVMMINRFRYRGMKEAFVHFGEPLLLSDFTARHPDADRKQRTRLLMEAAHEAVSNLIQPVSESNA